MKTGKARRIVKAMAKRSELCPDAVTAVLATAGHEVRSAPRPSGLTDREMQVLLLLVKGLTNKEIASALGCFIGAS